MKISMDKKYKTKSGLPVRILCVDAAINLPVIGLCNFGDGRDTVCYWKKEGNYYDDLGPSDFDLVEVTPYDDFKIDDKVLVSNDGEHWLPRHFAGTDSYERPTAFLFGTTSFTVDTELDSEKTCSYNYCKKYEPSNI